MFGEEGGVFVLFSLPSPISDAAAMFYDWGGAVGGDTPLFSPSMKTEQETC